MPAPTFLAQLGMQAASQAQQGLFGLALGGINDKRQIKQQKKLMALQLQGNKEMTDYQMAKELEMWNKTNYAAQKEQMKRAGLNPALMYGMGGGGGTTIGGSGMGVSGGQAPVGGGEAQALMTGMGLQMAQRELIQAQTEQVKAETEKTKTVDTEKTATETTSLKAQQELTKIDTDIKKVELQLKKETYWEAQETIFYNARKAENEAGVLFQEKQIADATYTTTIEKIKLEYATMLLQKAAIEKNVQLTEAQIKSTLQGIQTQIKQLQQADRALDQKDQDIIIDKARNELIELGIWVGGGTNLAGDLFKLLSPRKK